MPNILYIITVVVVTLVLLWKRNCEDMEVNSVPIERNSKDTGVDSCIFTGVSFENLQYYLLYNTHAQ